MDDNEENMLYTYLKYKYRLTDDDIEEYIDSFNIINQGNNITPQILEDFINDETDDIEWTVWDCKEVIIQINKKINSTSRTILDLRTYLLYIIPICNDYVITRIGIREIFDTLDENQDGKITCTELISLLYKINRQFDPKELELYKKQIKDLCVKADTDHDGFISYEEFKVFILSRGMVLGADSAIHKTQPTNNLEVRPSVDKKERRKSLSLNLGPLNRSTDDKQYEIPNRDSIYPDIVCPTRRNKYKHMSLPCQPRTDISEFDMDKPITKNKLMVPKINKFDFIISSPKNNSQEENIETNVPNFIKNTPSTEFKFPQIKLDSNINESDQDKSQNISIPDIRPKPKYPIIITDPEQPKPKFRVRSRHRSDPYAPRNI